MKTNKFYDIDNDEEFIETVEDDWDYLTERYEDYLGGFEYTLDISVVPLNFEYGYAKETGTISRTSYKYENREDILIVSFDLAFLKALYEMDYDAYISLLLHEQIHCLTSLMYKQNPNEHGEKFWRYADRLNKEIKQSKITQYADIDAIEKYIDSFD